MKRETRESLVFVSINCISNLRMYYWQHSELAKTKRFYHQSDKCMVLPSQSHERQHSKPTQGQSWSNLSSLVLPWNCVVSLLPHCCGWMRTAETPVLNAEPQPWWLFLEVLEVGLTWKIQVPGKYIPGPQSQSFQGFSPSWGEHAQWCSPHTLAMQLLWPSEAKNFLLGVAFLWCLSERCKATDLHAMHTLCRCGEGPDRQLWRILTSAHGFGGANTCPESKAEHPLDGSGVAWANHRLRGSKQEKKRRATQSRQADIYFLS